MGNGNGTPSEERHCWKCGGFLIPQGVVNLRNGIATIKHICVHCFRRWRNR